MIKSNYSLNEKQTLSSLWSSVYKPGAVKVSCFGKGITFIDKLYTVSEQIVCSIRDVDLSHNAISRLDNLKQFKNLQTLNLSHNYIADGKLLLKLQTLKKLHTVYIKGNPFLKSGEGMDLALQFLITKNTDLSLISRQSQVALEELMAINQKISLYQNLSNRIMLHIEFRKEYEPKVVTQDDLDTIVEEQKIYARNNKNLRNGIIERVFEEKIISDKSHNIALKNQLLINFLDGDTEIETLESRLLLQKKQKENQLEEIIRKIYNREIFMQNTLKNVERHQRSKEKKHRYNIEYQRSISPPRPQKLLYPHSPTKENIPSSQTRYQEYQQKIITKQQRKRKEVPEEKFESYYSTMLRKYSPVYQLLYSPLQSLKHNEKQLLIETLSSHLREKSYQVFKNEKLKQQLLNAKQEVREKERDLEYSEEMFNSYKDAMNERVHILEKENRQSIEVNKNLLEDIKQQDSTITTLKSKITEMGEDLSELKLYKIKQEHIKEEKNRQEELAEVIKAKRQERIRKMYFRMLVNQAQKLHHFQLSQIKSHASQQKCITQQVFQQWKYQYQLSKLTQKFQEMTQNNKNKYYVKNFIANATVQIKLKQTDRFLKGQQFQSFKKIISKKISQKISHRKIIEHCLLSSQHSVIKAIFGKWKQSTRQTVDLEKFRKTEEWHLFKTKQQYFTSWVFYTKQLAYKQAELTVDIRTKKYYRLLYRLQENWFSHKSIEVKFLNLIVFLNSNKRIKYFNTFMKNILIDRDCLQTKAYLIEKENKTRYLIQFCGLSIYNVKKRREHERKEKKLSQLIKKKTLLSFKRNQYQRTHQNVSLLKIFELYRKQRLYESYRYSTKEFCLTDYLAKSKVKDFFYTLKTLKYKKNKFRSKKEKLVSYLETGTSRKLATFSIIKYFFKNIQSPILNKHRLKRSLAKKYYNLMKNAFIGWKINAYQSQLENWQKKLEQLGSEINDIHHRHKNVYEEKQALIGIIEKREKQVKSYCKKLEEAEYTIQAKQQKYQKLKQMYVTNDNQLLVGHQHMMSSSKSGYFTGTFEQQSRIPERDHETLFESEKRDVTFLNNFTKF